MFETFLPLSGLTIRFVIIIHEPGLSDGFKVTMPDKDYMVT